MKKIISGILVFVLLIGLCSCTKKVSDYAYERAQISVEIVEDYLNGKISASDASFELDHQESLLDMHIEEVEEDTGKHPYADSMINIQISSLQLSVLSNSIGSESRESIEKELKELKKLMKK